MAVAVLAVAAMLGGVLVPLGLAPVEPAGATAPVPDDLGPSITFYDNFDNGLASDYPDGQNLPGWENLSPLSPIEWASSADYAAATKYPDQDGVLRATSATPLAWYEVSTLAVGNPNEGDPKTWQDLDMAVSVKRGATGSVGLYFRYDDTGAALRYYHLLLDSTGSTLARVDGSFFPQVLATDSTPIDLDTWYDVEVALRGGTIDVFIDDEHRMRGVDSNPLGAGRVALHSRSTDASFDDVRLEVPSDTFTIAVLPDTQFYTQDPSLTHFEEQTEWIARNRMDLDIVAVLHEGDVVASGGCLDTDPEGQWQRASDAMWHLDGKLPVGISAGNHDLFRYGNCRIQETSWTDCESETWLNATDPETGDTLGEWIGPDLFDEYFPPERYNTLGTYGGALDDGCIFRDSLTNSYHTITAGGLDLLLLSLNFGPTAEALQWANGVVAAHPDHLAIVVTHDFLGDDNELRGALCAEPIDDYCGHALPGVVNKIPGPGQPSNHNYGLDGATMWDQFVSQHENMRVVVNGHVVCGNDPCAARRFLAGDHGNDVLAMLANYQGVLPSGGEGYLRLLTFDVVQDTLTVRTVSPTASELTDSDNSFELDGVLAGRLSYSDVDRDTHPFADEIYDAHKLHLMGPYVDGTFKPGEPLSRLGAAVILYRALEGAGESLHDCKSHNSSLPAPFADISTTQKFCWPVHVMKGQGRIGGWPDNTFRPANAVSRQAFAVFMFGPAGTCPSGPAPFSDVPTSHPFCRAIRDAKDAGVVTGFPDGTFRPADPVERQAGAAMIVRFHDQL